MVSLQTVMRLHKLRHLTAEQAAGQLGLSMAELAEANRFAQVAFTDNDPEPPRPRATEAERRAVWERMPKRWQDRQNKA